MARIILCGASSVGKTTVATQWCKKHKEYYHIQEVARDVMKEHNLTREDMEKSLKGDPKKVVFLNLQRLILIAQNQHELNIPSSTPYISDRGPDPIVFAYVYGDLGAAKSLAESPEGKQCLERYRRCLVVLLCPLKAPTDDDFRFIQDMKQQQNFTDGMIFIFHHYKVPYVYINETDHTKRMHMLSDAVNGTLVIHGSMLQDGTPICVSFVTKKHPASTSVYIRCLLITTREIQCQYYRYDNREKDRMVDRYGTSKFVRLEFDKNVEASTVVHFLNYGMYIDGEEYQFIGCSQGGIKNRHCYMFKGSVELVKEVLAECGQFSVIKSTSKRLKRIGLLFSKATPTEVTIPEGDVIFVDDIENRNGNFTDGCGSISIKLAKAVIESAQLDLEDYLPSVYQIRYSGCKGVVSVDPNTEQPGLILRKSMKKFEPGTKPFNSIWLCDYSKPYSYGKLNKQFIMLLSGLGINDQIFLNKQQQFFEMIEKMTTSSEVATIMFLWNKQPDLARAAVKCQNIASESNKHLYQAICRLKHKYVDKLNKLSIFVEESRRVFGVCDQFDILEYGQCFIRPTIRGKPHTITGKVVVAKSPCYLLGDVRVLNAIDNPKLHHLVDCIVFPTKGKQPHPNEIAGSDLDGDEFFVCWDEQLIPCKLREPYNYPSVENRNTPTTTREMMISYLSKQNQQSSMMGKINNNFQWFADLKGVDCTECKELGVLFSRSVDQTKTGDVVKITKHLQRPNDPTDETTNQKPAQNKVWLIMQQKAEEKKKGFANKVDTLEVSACSESFMWYLVQESSAINDFKLFCLVQQWCQSQYSSEEEVLTKLLEFSQCIDFGKMSIGERITVMDAGIPKELVMNSLNWSKLLTPEMLSHFSMQSPHCGWHCYLSSSTRFQWIHLMQAVQKYKESFVVVDLGDGLICALHFSCTLPLGESEIAPGSVTAYFFSSHFDYKGQHILGKNYYVNLEDGVLQLYRNNNKAQTFIWLRSEAKSKEGELVFDRMSIDLQTYGIKKHPKVNKQSFHSIEVYVRNVSGLPVYFDIYNANQYIDQIPEVVIYDEIDELPDYNNEKVTQKINLPKSNTINNYLETLRQISDRGDCKTFLEALPTILSHEEYNLLAHRSMLCTCLNVLLLECVTKSAHKSLHEDEIETLQIIIVELQALIVDPLECVQLLSKLSRLKCPDLLKQVLGSILPHIQLSNISSFIDICLSWKSWYFIPLEIALKLLERLFILHQSVVSTHTKPSSTDNCTIFELATSLSSHMKSNPVMLQYYSSHFAYLLLSHLLHEMTNKREVTCNKNEDTGHNLVKLSADDPSNRIIDEDDDREASYKRVTFHRSQNIKKTSISKYTWVSINLMTKEAGKIISTPVAIGEVVNVTNVPACIVVDVHQPVPNCLMQSIRLTEVSKCHWELCSIGNITAFRRAMKCLNNICNGQVCGDIVSLLVHPSGFLDTDRFQIGFSDKPLFQENLSSKPPHEMEGSTNTENIQLSPALSFNCSQQKAIRAALKQRLTLIHGPPGTGKTLLACQIVNLFCKQLQDKERILVTAETNMAVDNLTRKLLEHNIKVVRVGRLDLISDDIHHVTLEQHKELSKDGSPKFVTKTVLRSVQVIATTCTGAGDLAIKEFCFPYVIIDEATQVTEPNSLVPLMNNCQQLTLIGDPAQLSPTLLAVTPEDDGSNLPQVKQLTQTLFHRLQKVLPPYFLNEQYRMHPSIAEFPSTTFYDGKLNSAQMTMERASIKSPLFIKPIVFIDAPSKETRCGRSYMNEVESDVVIKLVAQLIEDNINPSSIAILTPYAAQVIKIKEYLTLKVTEVCTIDAFQGREKDVIIFSTVRCNSHGTLGFTDDKYRMNVLLTRAKRGIIGVGCKKTLNASRLWKKWLQQLRILTIDDLSALLEKSSTTSCQGQGVNHNANQKSMWHREKSGRHHEKKYTAVIRGRRNN